jgi:hypothetical protein
MAILQFSRFSFAGLCFSFVSNYSSVSSFGDHYPEQSDFGEENKIKKTSVKA